MDFLVELALDVPEGTPENEVNNREKAEALAATALDPHPNDPTAGRARSAVCAGSRS